MGESADLTGCSCLTPCSTLLYSLLFMLCVFSFFGVSLDSLKKLNDFITFCKALSSTFIFKFLFCVSLKLSKTAVSFLNIPESCSLDLGVSSFLDEAKDSIDFKIFGKLLSSFLMSTFLISALLVLFASSSAVICLSVPLLV